MAYTITIPFHAVKLRFPSGGDIWMPLLDKDALSIDANLKNLANNYADSFQENLLDKGAFESVLHEFQEGPFLQKILKVAFEASGDQFSYPDFELEFQYIYQTLDTGQCWGFVPVLGCEALGGNLEILEESLEEVILLDISRNDRLRNLQRIVSLIWFDAVEIFDTPIKLSFPTPKEQKLDPASKEESWLQKVAFPPRVKNRAAYGREKELNKLVRTLKSPYVKNVVLLGPRGVGKSALVWELIRQKKKLGIKEEVWETTAAQMIKELSTEMGWQGNLTVLCKEIQSRKIFLYVRNLYELFEVGKYEGNTVSMADYLVPFLGRGEITLISECTSEEKSLIDVKNPGFLTHFQLLQLEEPKEILEEIILKKVSDIAKDQKVQLKEEGIQELIRLNKRYTPYAGFPGKPIRFLESLLMHKKAFNQGEKREVVLGKSEIIRQFCLETGMPPFMVDPAIPIDFEKVRTDFSSNVFGQEEAVDSLINVLTSVKTGMSRTGKPIASFLFVGPTGVGKTELVKVLANFMFGSRDRLTRFDMSEYATAYGVKSLLGFDHHSEGLLTNAVRREPFGVILFDEIEKAHSIFFDYLLQVLSEGRLTDSKGQIANFCSTIIILTSNIGAGNLQTNRIGWKKELETDTINQHFLSAVEDFFRPELFNRLDQVISFQPLSRETMRLVVDREVKLLKTREGINGRKMSLEMEPQVLDYLALAGYNPLYGARYLQRTIQTQLAIPLAYLLNQRDSIDHVLVKVQVENDKLKIEAETDPLSMDLLLEEVEKNTLANLISDKRREVQRLEEGSVFLELSNELAILEVEKDENSSKFWSNQEKSKQYDQFFKFRSELDLVKRDVENLEMDISLSSVGYSLYHPSISQQVDGWKTRWEHFQRDLFLQLHPEGTCWLAIYGKSLEPILNSYKEIIEDKGFSIEGGGIWYEDGPIPSAKRKLDEKEIVATESGKQHLSYLPWNPKKLYDRDRTLYGVHWKIVGPGAWWFFKDESGIQKWLPGKKVELLYAVYVFTERPALPSNIHRMDFYTHQPIRRTVSPNKFSDAVYKVKGEPLEGDISSVTDVLNDILHEKFQRLIRDALF